MQVVKLLSQLYDCAWHQDGHKRQSDEGMLSFEMNTTRRYTLHFDSIPTDDEVREQLRRVRPEGEAVISCPIRPTKADVRRVQRLIDNYMDERNNGKWFNGWNKW